MRMNVDYRFGSQNYRAAVFLVKFLQHLLSSTIIRPDLVVLNLKSFRDVGFVLSFLKLSFNFKASTLLDITATDFPQKVSSRFRVDHVLVSVSHNLRFVVRTVCSGDDFFPSVSSIFPGATWLEREVWDMFGLQFEGQVDLRRILTDYGFEGHPLRKDFPLGGFTEVGYDDERKSITSRPLESTQEFRFFEFKSPWEIMLCHRPYLLVNCGSLGILL